MKHYTGRITFKFCNYVWCFPCLHPIGENTSIFSYVLPFLSCLFPQKDPIYTLKMIEHGDEPEELKFLYLKIKKEWLVREIISFDDYKIHIT